MATDDPTADLPPRPDRETGQPVPPDAPTQTAEGFNERTPSRVPAAPPEHGPVLAYYRQRRYLAWFAGLIPASVVLFAAMLRDGVGVVGHWLVWVFVIPAYAWTVYVGRGNVVTAGSDWVMCRKYWVDTYELTKIDARAYGANEPTLTLEDGERSVEMPISLIESNRTLWNYVYLGMRHSAANGAEVTLPARGTWPELAPSSRNARTEKE